MFIENVFGEVRRISQLKISGAGPLIRPIRVPQLTCIIEEQMGWRGTRLIKPGLKMSSTSCRIVAKRIWHTGLKIYDTHLKICNSK